MFRTGPVCGAHRNIRAEPRLPGFAPAPPQCAQVGCCTLKVENVECLPPNHIKFDFLGKDSIT